MRIAHFSDLHVLSLAGVSLPRFANKRLTGLLNLKLKRNSIHRSAYVRAIAREVARVKVDHVVITGDITNLSLEPEFEMAKTILEDELHLTPEDVSIVPGNHDIYTLGALKKRRFAEYFADYVHCDIDVAVDIGTGHFPYVKLRGPCAIIGMSSAVPRPPFMAAGVIGDPQLAALARALVHPEVASRIPIILVHHPALNPVSRLKAYLDGLHDAPRLLEHLRSVRRGLVLHGHLHRRIARTFQTDTGQVLHVGATSASLHDERGTRMAGFNLYDIGEKGVSNIEAHVFDPDRDAFRVEAIPRA